MLHLQDQESSSFILKMIKMRQTKRKHINAYLNIDMHIYVKTPKQVHG